MSQLMDPRPLGDLFSELAQDTATLVRHEVQLVTVEMTGKAKTAGRDAAQFGVGAAIAMIGALALTAATILVLALAIPLWASALIVGLVVSTLGGGIAVLGLRGLKQLDPAPRQTLQILREDKQWLREQVSR